MIRKLNTWLPMVTVAIIVFNEEERIERVLVSAFKQNYPKNKLEIFVVDDGSSDKTVEIAKKFPVKIMVTGKKDPEYSISVAIQKAHGEFFTTLAGDMEFRTKSWLRQMVKPLVENPDIVQSATRYYRSPRESITSQFLSLDPLQLDPIYKFLVPSLESTIVEKKNGYFITKYNKEKIPPQCAGMYRTSIMKKFYRKEKTWVDIDFLYVLVEKGFKKFAYVPNAGYYHFHVKNFSQLLQKRSRNLNKIYLPNVKKRRYKWFDLGKRKDFLKLVFWVILANLIFPLFTASLFKSVRHKSFLYLLEAPLAFILTDYLLFNFVKNPLGRKLISNGIVSCFRIKK